MSSPLATKNGAMMLEAVVFFDTKLAEDFIYRRMRGGQLVSKGRYLAAQMLAYLKDDLWLDNAKLANSLAAQLADGLRKFEKIRISNPVQANEVFAVMPRTLNDKLLASGVNFYDRMPSWARAWPKMKYSCGLFYPTPPPNPISGSCCR